MTPPKTTRKRKREVLERVWQDGCDTKYAMSNKNETIANALTELGAIEREQLEGLDALIKNWYNKITEREYHKGKVMIIDLLNLATAIIRLKGVKDEFC